MSIKHDSDEYKCSCGDTFRHHLEVAAPEIEFLHVEDVGSYQGSVFAIGKYNGQVFVMHDYYGSCSGCGAWGEGGEPTNLQDVLENGELFERPADAITFAAKTYGDYGSPEIPTEAFWSVLNWLATGVQA